MGVNISEKKPALIEWLTKLEDQKIPEKLLELSRQHTDHYQPSDQEREAILKGLEDLRKGNVVPNSDVRKAYERWL